MCDINMYDIVKQVKMIKEESNIYSDMLSKLENIGFEEVAPKGEDRILVNNEPNLYIIVVNYFNLNLHIFKLDLVYSDISNKEEGGN